MAPPTSIHPHPPPPAYYILNTMVADGHANQGKSSYVDTIFPEQFGISVR